MENETILIALNALMGVCVPPIVERVSSKHYSRVRKSFIALGCSALVAILTSGVVLLISGINTQIDIPFALKALGAIIVTTEKSYTLYWKGKYEKQF